MSKLDALISHGAIQPHHVDKMVSHVNSWDPKDQMDEEKYGKTDDIMKGLRSISRHSASPEVLDRFHSLNKVTDEGFSFPSKLNKIRSNLAENPHTPSHVLFDITQKDPRFIGTIAKNPSLSPDHAHELVKGTEIWDVKRLHNLAIHPNLKEESKDDILSKAENAGVDYRGASYALSRLAQNPNLSVEHQKRIYKKATELTKGIGFTGYDALANLADHPKLDHNLARQMMVDHGKDDELMDVLKSNRHLPPGVTE